jgi:hypothetical protein
MLPVDSMMKQAADNISRRYNLNDIQSQFTHDMLVQEVSKFLEEHEDEIWPLIRDLARHQQSGGKKLDAKTAMRLGRAIQPIYQAAKERILEANSEWREILTPQQRKLHDYDLMEMDKTFNEMQGNFQQWERGNPVKQGIFPEPREDKPPVNPKRPRIGEDSTNRVIGPNEDWWDSHVAKFIRDYELDQAQITAAKSILNEMKQRAASRRAARKAEFEAVAKKLAQARKKNDREKIRLANEEQAKLSAFVTELFQELKDRLDKIPTPAQRKRYEQKLEAGRGGQAGSSKATETKSKPKRSVKQKAGQDEQPAKDSKSKKKKSGGK